MSSPAQSDYSGSTSETSNSSIDSEEVQNQYYIVDNPPSPGPAAYTSFLDHDPFEGPSSFHGGQPSPGAPTAVEEHQEERLYFFASGATQEDPWTYAGVARHLGADKEIVGDQGVLGPASIPGELVGQSDGGRYFSSEWTTTPIRGGAMVDAHQNVIERGMEASLHCKMTSSELSYVPEGVDIVDFVIDEGLGAYINDATTGPSLYTHNPTEGDASAYISTSNGKLPWALSKMPGTVVYQDPYMGSHIHEPVEYSIVIQEKGPEPQGNLPLTTVNDPNAPSSHGRAVKFYPFKGNTEQPVSRHTLCKADRSFSGRGLLHPFDATGWSYPVENSSKGEKTFGACWQTTPIYGRWKTDDNDGRPDHHTGSRCARATVTINSAPLTAPGIPSGVHLLISTDGLLGDIASLPDEQYDPAMYELRKDTEYQWEDSADGSRRFTPVDGPFSIQTSATVFAHPPGDDDPDPSDWVNVADDVPLTLHIQPEELFVPDHIKSVLHMP